MCSQRSHYTMIHNLCRRHFNSSTESRKSSEQMLVSSLDIVDLSAKQITNILIGAVGCLICSISTIDKGFLFIVSTILSINALVLSLTCHLCLLNQFENTKRVPNDSIFNTSALIASVLVVSSSFCIAVAELIKLYTFYQVRYFYLLISLCLLSLTLMFKLAFAVVNNR